MTTKQYLSQLHNIDKRIKDKLKEADMWRDIASSTGASMSEIKVQTSKKHDPQGDAISLAIDYEEESRCLAKYLTEIKHTIIEQIDKIENNLHYNILKGYYIQDKSFFDIASEENYSYKQIKRHYKNAIQEFEEKYGNEYIDKHQLVHECPYMSDIVPCNSKI